MKNQDKLWGGRFTGATASSVESFTSSVAFDQRLYRQDIAGSIAHARMLNTIKVLSDSEFSAIEAGLKAIGSQIESGDFSWRDELEDVHMNIEKQLTEQIGAAGKKLHTARSRNDQVATDLRLYVRDAIDTLVSELASFQHTLLNLAEREAATIMPGFTHLQTAQPITFGHHLNAWFEMLDRDRNRFMEARKRTNCSPLGAAALAGTSFPIDRQMTASELGFSDLCRNSVDAVSDRDFAIEFASNAAILMMHFSRMGEELILWACEGFRFVEIADSFTTGSSIMPQKKNPDIAELVRGKSARCAGNLQTLLMLMKAQPLAYNRDNQEDKEALFDTVDTATACTKIMHAMIDKISPNRERMRAAAAQGFATATDLADFLTARDVPFREAHAAAGKIVRHCIEHERALESLTLDELNSLNAGFDSEALAALSPEHSVAARNHVGGTAPEQVLAAVAEGRSRLHSNHQ